MITYEEFKNWTKEDFERRIKEVTAYSKVAFWTHADMVRNLKRGK